MSNLVSYALIQTLNELKEALDISGGDHDAKLNGYINRATDIIETYCGRRFLQTTYTNEEYSGDNSNYIILRNWPVTTLSSLQKRNGDFSNPDWESIDTSLYTLKNQGGKDRGIVFLHTGFLKGVDNYRVTYTAGYTAADIPHDLREACIEIVSCLFNRRKATPGMRSETLGRYSYTTEPREGKSIIAFLGLTDILDQYRTIRV